MKRWHGVVLFLAPVVGWLAGCAIDDQKGLTQSELLHERLTIQFQFKAVVGAAEDLCQHGPKSNFLGYSPKAVYLARVKAYNESQADLKEHGHKGPAEYPAKIPDFDKGQFTDWCKVKTEVTGLSCADDL